ncbi:hypothetical protein HMPREF3192_00692 [Atopobium deltae]|uniref:Uncharacterized protein n=1 Tax=Atopobium deltae TaxID=1393034 RepID=A0A133XVH4_9ACTN|nr:hypothetical protein HMPREF3192_00692 [Atopobium deltae]
MPVLGDAIPSCGGTPARRGTRHHSHPALFVKACAVLFAINNHFAIVKKSYV